MGRLSGNLFSHGIESCRVVVVESSDLCKATVDALKAADLEGAKAYTVWTVGRDAAKAKLKEMIEVYGSVGKAWTPVPKGLPKEETTMDEKKN